MKSSLDQASPLFLNRFLLLLHTDAQITPLTCKPAAPSLSDMGLTRTATFTASPPPSHFLDLQVSKRAATMKSAAHPRRSAGGGGVYCQSVSLLQVWKGDTSYYCMCPPKSVRIVCIFSYFLLEKLLTHFPGATASTPTLNDETRGIPSEEIRGWTIRSLS